jgi:hypothetical protein
MFDQWRSYHNRTNEHFEVLINICMHKLSKQLETHYFWSWFIRVTIRLCWNHLKNEEQPQIIKHIFPNGNFHNYQLLRKKKEYLWFDLYIVSSLCPIMRRWDWQKKKKRQVVKFVSTFWKLLRQCERKKTIKC